jgi:hypothetical protein
MKATDGAKVYCAFRICRQALNPPIHHFFKWLLGQSAKVIYGLSVDLKRFSDMGTPWNRNSR